MAYFNIDKDGRNNVAKDLTQSDVELVEGHQVSSVFSSHGLGNVDGDSPTFKTNAEAQNYTTSNDHAEADGSSFKCCTDGVQAQRDDDGHSTTYCLVQGAKKKCTANRSQWYARRHKRDL